MSQLEVGSKGGKSIGGLCNDHDFGHLCRGRRIQISGHSDFEIFNRVVASSILTWVYADTASAACPAHPGSLAITSITFAAVICDADESCSVNIAEENRLSQCHLGVHPDVCIFQIVVPTPNS